MPTRSPPRAGPRPTSHFNERARRILQWLVYPLVVGSTAATGWLALKAGCPALVATIIANVEAGALVIALERALPYREEWRRSHQDLRVDLYHFFFSSGAAQIGAALALALLALGSARLVGALGIGLWPRGIPIGLQILIAIALGDLAYYWLHRAFHHTALWRLHAIHHSAPRIYWLNSYRNHPADFLLSIVVTSGPAVALGAGEEVIAMVAVVTFAAMLLDHANIAMRLGRLNLVLAAGETHRWHHSRDIAEANHNYGSFFMVWDRIFGTFYLPEDREPPVDVGLTDMPNYPQDYAGQLMAPFRGGALMRPQRENARILAADGD